MSTPPQTGSLWVAGSLYFLNFYSLALSISWTYFPFYTLLTVAGLSRTDDLLCAHLKTIYFFYLSEASLSILHIVFLDSLRAFRIARRHYGRRSKLWCGNTSLALHLLEDVGLEWSGYEQCGHVSLTIKGREAESWNSLDNHIILIQLHLSRPYKVLYGVKSKNLQMMHALLYLVFPRACLRLDPKSRCLSVTEPPVWMTAWNRYTAQHLLGGQAADEWFSDIQWQCSSIVIAMNFS